MVQKIKVANPVVDLDGDEMTRYFLKPFFSFRVVCSAALHHGTSPTIHHCCLQGDLADDQGQGVHDSVRCLLVTSRHTLP